jgi:hypothetical protein
MEMENTQILRDQSIKVDGSLISKMVKAKNNGQMVPLMKAFIEMVSKMDSVNISGPKITHATKESGAKI